MSSHRQIFKSTALIGGTQVITMGIGIVRTKLLALLLGPAGIGLAGLYMSATSLIGSISGLGLNASGVRQIAEAAGSNDQIRIARTIITLRRLSLISGALGMFLVLMLSPLLSRTTFGDKKHIFGLGLMSFTLLFGSISAGQGALLQGLRRLRDLAAAQVLGAVFGAMASIALVWCLREQGIVPFLVAVSAFATLLSWWFARRVMLIPVKVSWKETFGECRELLLMGIATTVAALISSGLAFLTRVLVQRELGMDAVGIYTATWTLSTYYVGFVLMAMGTDFLPRLTATIHDHAAFNRLINEQTEMGVLIAVPGVLATLTLAPWVMRIFYSGNFVEGADVVRWQILGVFLQVVSWPLGYVAYSKRRIAIFTLTELAFGGVSVASLLLCMKWWRLEGVGISYALSYLFYTGMMALVVWRMTGFRWSVSTVKIFWPVLMSVAATFVGTRCLPERWSVPMGLGITALAALIATQTLQRLLKVNFWERLTKKFGLAPQSND